MINSNISYNAQKQCQKLTNFTDMFHYWYSRTFILFSLRESMINREVTFMNKEGLIIKPLKVTSLQGINYYFDKYKFFENRFDIYASIAILKDMPETSVSNEELKEVRKELKKNWNKYVVGYDFFIDVDCDRHICPKCKDEPDIKKKEETCPNCGTELVEAEDNFKTAKEWSIKIMDYFNEKKYTYHKKFSGNKGFHFTIPYKYMKEKFKDYKSFAEKIAKKLEIQFIKGYGIDNSTFDKRRICKIPYSLSSKTNLVALPVTDEQLINFKKEDYSVSNVLNNVKPLVMRGLLVKNV